MCIGVEISTDVVAEAEGQDRGHHTQTGHNRFGELSTDIGSWTTDG